MQDIFDKTVKKSRFYDDFKYFLKNLKNYIFLRTKMSTQRLMERQSVGVRFLIVFISLAFQCRIRNCSTAKTREDIRSKVF